MIKLGKIFLMILLGILIILYLKKKNSTISTIIMLVIILFGTLFILFSEISTQIANILGFGRGVDLIFYLSVISGIFIVILNFSEIRVLKRKITSQTQQQALDHPIRSVSESGK